MISENIVLSAAISGLDVQLSMLHIKIAYCGIHILITR